MICGTGFRLVQLDEVWPHFAARAARSRTPAETLQWVLARCRQRLALCLLCDDGIVVMTLGAGVCAWLRARVLLAVSIGGAGVFGRREDEIALVARDMGAGELAFRTDRPAAWRRLLGARWIADGDLFWRTI